MVWARRWNSITAFLESAPMVHLARRRFSMSQSVIANFQKVAKRPKPVLSPLKRNI